MSSTTNVIEPIKRLLYLSMPIMGTRFWAISLPFMDAMLLSYYSIKSLNILSSAIPVSHIFFLISTGLLGSSITLMSKNIIKQGELIVISIILGSFVIILGLLGSIFSPKHLVIPIILCAISSGIAVYIYIITIIVEYNGMAIKCLKVSSYCFFINLIADVIFIFYTPWVNGVIGCILATLIVRVMTGWFLTNNVTAKHLHFNFNATKLLFKSSATFAINAGLFYSVIVFLIYLEAKHLNDIDFAIFNMLLNITNFAFVLFIGLNIGIQMFLKEINHNDYHIIKIIVTAYCCVVLAFIIGVIFFIKISNFFFHNNIFDIILVNKMFYFAILNLFTEGFLISLIAYLTWTQNHNKINIIKVIMLYVFITIMLLMKLFEFAFMFILLANIICIAIILLDIRNVRMKWLRENSENIPTLRI